MCSFYLFSIKFSFQRRRRQTKSVRVKVLISVNRMKKMSSSKIDNGLIITGNEAQTIDQSFSRDGSRLLTSS